MQKVTPLLLVIYLLIQGCSVFRRSAVEKTGIDKEALTNGDIVENNISNGNFYIQKATVSISEDDVTTRFLATVKFKRPDSVLISIRARIGIEAARIFMTTDTLIIIDRINRKVRAGNPEMLKEKYGVDPALIFVIFGDFIVDKRSNGLPVKCHGGSSENRFVIEGRNVLYRIDCGRKKIVGATFEGEESTGDIYLQFSDFRNFDELIMPGMVDISGSRTIVKAKIEVEKGLGSYAGTIGGIRTGTNYEVIRLR